MRRRNLLKDTGGGFVTLTVTVNANVKQIDVTVNGVKTTYTRSTTVQIQKGAIVSWTATANTGYTMSASSGNFGEITTNQTIAPTASVTIYTLTITKYSGVKSITVTIGANSPETFTSSTTRSVAYGTKVTWTPVAEDGYELDTDTASGTISSMTSNQKIYPVTIYNFVWDGQPTVDLGFGPVWQAFNLGASRPEEYGLYYQWGDTKGYSGACKESESDGNEDEHYFDNSKYKYYDTTEKVYTKYNATDKLSTLENEDDAAYVASGGQYRIPTSSEYKELYSSSNTTSYWAKCNGVKGLAFISNKNGKGIFFPAAGDTAQAKVRDAGVDCCVWSNNGGGSVSTNWATYFNYKRGDVIDSLFSGQRVYGRSVRGVVA